MASSPTLCTSTGWWTEAMPEAVEAVSYGGIEVRSVAPHAHLRASAREPAPCTWRHGPCGRAGQAGRHGFDVRRHQEQPNGKRSSALAARGHANRLEVDAVHLRGARTKSATVSRQEGWMGGSAHASARVSKQGPDMQQPRELALGVSEHVLWASGRPDRPLPCPLEVASIALESARRALSLGPGAAWTDGRPSARNAERTGVLRTTSMIVLRTRNTDT